MRFVGIGVLLSIQSPSMASSQGDELNWGYCQAELRKNLHLTPMFRTRLRPYELNKQFYEYLVQLWGKRSAAASCFVFDTEEGAEKSRTWMGQMSPLRREMGFILGPGVNWTPDEKTIAARPAEKPQAENSQPKPASTSPVAKGPTPNQLKFQRELAEYKRKLEEHNARLAEIEKIKADTAAKHAADTAAAERELARHRQELAVADAAQRKYEQDLAAHELLVRGTETKQDREQKVEWREAVVVCMLNPSDGQSQFGNWRCDGPLQMTYAKLGSSGDVPSNQALTALSEACGGSREAIRDLGMASGARLFGCSFGLHPNATTGYHLDAAAKHGISFVPGRAIYRCPAYKSYCRTQ